MTTTSAPWALQNAIYTILDADNELMGQLRCLYHELPKDIAYPSAVLMMEREEDISSVSGSRIQCIVKIDILGRDRSPESVMTIAARIKTLLDKTHPTLANGTVQGMYHLVTDVRPDTSGEGFNASVSFRTIVVRL
ncbi:MAG: hypothetical protein K0R63_969 [Rickettsiales bacterium]|jgi:hypothetical protein|nr:hypothetical protein [Rickettsiales bacterium]